MRVLPLTQIALAAAFAATSANACMRPTVGFKFGSAQLSPEGRTEVMSVVKAARAVPDARVVVTAVTDGSKANLQMAQRRVALIRAMMVQRGLPARSVVVKYDRGRGAIARSVSMDVISAPTCG